MCSSSLPEAISRKPVNYTIKLPRLQMKCMPTSAELADEEQVSSEAFGDILNAMLIARYGKTIIAAEVKK